MRNLAWSSFNSPRIRKNDKYLSHDDETNGFHDDETNGFLLNGHDVDYYGDDYHGKVMT